MNAERLVMYRNVVHMFPKICNLRVLKVLVPVQRSQ